MELTEEQKRFWEQLKADQEAKNQKLIDNINVAKERVVNKDKVISELEHERGLLFNDFLYQIKALKDSQLNLFFGWKHDALWNAWRSQSCKDTLEREVKEGKITKEDVANYEDHLKVAAELVRKAFFSKFVDGETAKFVNITMMWTVGYEFTYEYTVCFADLAHRLRKKKLFITIFVPNFNPTNEKDYIYSLNGYSVNFKSSKESWVSNYVCHNINYEKAADAFVEWVGKAGWTACGEEEADD